MSAQCGYELALYHSTFEGLLHGPDLEPNDTPSIAPWVPFERPLQSSLGFLSERSTSEVFGSVDAVTDPDDYYDIQAFFPGDLYTIEVDADGSCTLSLTLDAGLVPPPLVLSEELTGGFVRDLSVDVEASGLLHVSGDCNYSFRIHRR